MSGRLGAERVDYRGGLEDAEAPAAPLPILTRWIEEAVARSASAGDVPEPTSIAVATVDADGAPDVRVVLMRDLDERGPCFYTHLTSDKGRQLEGDDRVAVALTWPSMYRAVRLRGRAELLPRDQVHAYFRSRPWGSRVGAHASDQSRPVTDRSVLEAAFDEAARRFPDTGSVDDVPLPEGWGGYRVVADRVELWAGRPSRLHDRIVWERTGDGGLDDPAAWRRSRLMP